MSLAIALDLLNSFLEFGYYALFVILFADVFIGILVYVFTACAALMGLREGEDVFQPKPNPR